MKKSILAVTALSFFAFTSAQNNNGQTAIGK